MSNLLLQQIRDTDFLVVDVETTGLSANEGDRVCEVGAVKLRGGAVVESFGSLINPQRPISGGAYSVNLISPQMVADAPTFAEIADQFAKMARGCVLVAYNAPFDLSFLQSELRLAGHRPLRNPVVDALALARQLLPGLDRYPQENVADVIGIPFPVKHRAAEDAFVTAQIFMTFVGILNSYDMSIIADLQRSDLSRHLQAKRLDIVESALSGGRRLWIRYLSPFNGEVTERFVTPKQLASQDLAEYPRRSNRNASREVTYLIAHCHSAGAERNFRVDRILSIKILD